MRVSKEKAAENREALLNAAGRLFRARGIDGVGVADIGREAGLTHGALYAHFDSKEALAAAAMNKGLEHSLASMARSGGEAPGLGRYLDFLFSARMRDTLEEGCPLAASASEVARQGEPVAACFTEGFMRMAALVEASLDPALPAGERRRIAFTTIAAQIGAIAATRAIAKIDPALSDDVLESVKSVLGQIEHGRPAP
ncbi:TetR/AcrR family transcriptional regulator [Burkholderia perseverans]|uniref:TetR/AcrR family transcriptional regulator n=1 Tax=Burkholderia perseverans TaxID=2615214 RepID=UPI001FEDC33F|nr:TetR/AcrR family transcriptional regulator [Burkholderia perseverans]